MALLLLLAQTGFLANQNEEDNAKDDDANRHLFRGQVEHRYLLSMQGDFSFLLCIVYYFFVTVFKG